MKFVKQVRENTKSFSSGFSVKDSDKLTALELQKKEDDFVRDMVLKFKNDPPKGYRVCAPSDLSFLGATGVRFDLIADRGVFLVRRAEYRVDTGGSFDGEQFISYHIVLEKAEPQPLYRQLAPLDRKPGSRIKRQILHSSALQAMT